MRNRMTSRNPAPTSTPGKLPKGTHASVPETVDFAQFLQEVFNWKVDVGGAPTMRDRVPHADRRTAHRSVSRAV